MRRERTNTPLQALLLLNDPQYVEAARALAERAMLRAGDDPQMRAAYMFRLCTAQHPNQKERDELVGVFHDHRTHFADHADDAGQFIAVGESEPDASLDPVELAAWTMVANLILNLDEVVSKN
jgi:hypothetical protein